MALAESTALTVSELRTRIRFECDDPEAAPTGATYQDAERRFTDADILRAMTAAFKDIENWASQRETMFAQKFVDVSVTESLITLPAEIVGETIYHVEDIRNPSIPYDVHIIDSRERSTWRLDGPLVAARATIERLDPSGSTGHPGWQLRLHPVQNDTTTVRVWYIQAPVVPASDSDAHALTVRWSDLVVLLATKKLLRRFNAFTSQQQEDLDIARLTYRNFRIVRQTGRIRQSRRSYT